jgi:hypothetical protein
MRCMNICPHRAIETTHTITGILWYLCWSLIPGAVLYFLVSNGYIDVLHYSWVTWLVFYLVAIPLSFFMVGIAHRILHYLTRFRIMNRIILLTSFTSFRFWRRYRPEKALKNSGIR